MASSWLLVTAATPDGAAQALVAADAPGVTVVELDSLDLTRRFAEVRFDGGARSEPRSRRCTGGATTDHLAARPGHPRSSPPRWSGRWSATSTTTVQYAKDRIAFGRPIGSFQGIKHQLADTSLALEMSKAITLAAARTVGEGDEYGPYAASMAKAFVGDAGIELVQTCFQVYGGIGYTWEHDQHLYLRRITTDAELFGNAALAPRAGLPAGRDLRGDERRD